MAIVTKPCKHGSFTFLDNDKWIGKALLQTGEYSETEVEKLLSLIDEQSVVIEVGAHWGSISVPLAQKAAKLFAFEPQRVIFDLLEKNLVQNCHGFCCEQFIVGCKPGRAGMAFIDYDMPDINTGSIELRWDQPPTCNIITLDDYCTEFDRLDLIKIDAEGSELDVIAGAERTIEKFRPLLYVENDRQDKSHDLIEQIMALGYELAWHFPPLYNPDPFGVQDCVSINMLCLPHGRYVTANVTDCIPVMSADDDWRLAYSKQQQKERPDQTQNITTHATQIPPRSEHSPAVVKKRWACVVRLGGVGDNLIASAVLPYLKEKYGAVEVICAEPQHVIFENNPHVDKLSVKKQGQPPWGDGKSWQAYWQDRASEVAFFAQLSHSCEGLRAYHETSTAYWWPAATRRKKEFGGQSYLEAVADICGVPYDRLEPNFYPTGSELTDAERTKNLIGGRYIAWIISGTRFDKVWPPTAMAVSRIIHELSMPVVLFGMPGKDFEIAKTIESTVAGLNGSTRDLHLALSTSIDKPNWPLRRSLTQVQLADMVVSPDTGPAWAVAMHDIPKIVMVSHASAENITKHWRYTTTLHADPIRVPCWPCHQLHDTKEMCLAESRRCGLLLPDDTLGAACISDIPVDRLIKAIRDQFSHQQRGRLALAAE